MWPVGVCLVVGIAGSLVLLIGSATGGPMALSAIALLMVVLSAVTGFVIVWRDARRSGTGWFRAARRALTESLQWLFALLW